MKLSIKTRVTLLCTFLTAAISILALNVLIFGVQQIQKDYDYRSMISTAELAEDEIRYERGTLKIDRNLDDLPGVRVTLYSPDGDLIYGRRWLDLPFQEGVLRNGEGLGGNTWLVYDTLLQFETGEDIWLRCQIDADDISDIQSDSARLALILIPILVIAAGIGGYGVARHAFRPVARIARTAESIADGSDLKKRIALNGARDELYTLANTFDAMLERLDRSFERERQFTADVSHELRTPLTSILTQSEFGLSESAGDEDRREALEIIHKKSSAMSNLVRRLLLLARMDAGQTPLIPEDVDLGEMAEIAAETFCIAAQVRGISIRVDTTPPLVVTADQTMLMQAILNLIDNAVRYCNENGLVHVITGVSGKAAFIAVEDNGPGIPESELPRIFDRFHQVDSSRHSEGAGLGLSLTRRIAQLHGGEVRVESTVGVGTRFTLMIPLKGEGL